MLQSSKNLVRAACLVLASLTKTAFDYVMLPTTMMQCLQTFCYPSPTTNLFIIESFRKEIISHFQNFPKVSESSVMVLLETSIPKLFAKPREEGSFYEISWPDASAHSIVLKKLLTPDATHTKRFGRTISAKPILGGPLKYPPTCKQTFNNFPDSVTRLGENSTPSHTDVFVNNAKI
jgi:hypothetical protein